MTIQNVKIEFQTRLRNFYDIKEIQSMFELLAQDLGFSKTDIVLNPTKELNDVQTQFFNKTLELLTKHQPVQYIREKADFYGFEFCVSNSVLIPRQETELLVDTIIKNNKIENPTILDLGTGSGCIAISLAYYLKQSQVFALDISTKALDIARKNAQNQNVDVTFIEDNMLNISSMHTIPQIDILVSNPPYVRNSEKSEMKKNVLEFEPHSALFVEDSNPLIFYAAIAKIAKEKLTKNGIVYCEINEALGNETLQLFKDYGFADCSILLDLHNKPRFIKASI